MEYRSGSLKRIFTVRFDEGDDFLDGMRQIIIKENIRCAWFQVLGGSLGPVMPPEPVWAQIEGAYEALGSGSIYWDETEPRIHLHAALGHHGETLTACVRKGTKVYLILEVLIMELDGIAATRPWFAEGGFNRLTFNS